MRADQTVAAGYFGGYIGKRQLSGKAELEKCIRHMYSLHGEL